MHPTHFGFCLPVFAAPGGRMFRTPNYATLDVGMTMSLAQEADRLDFDDLWVADHLMLGKDNAILEGWTTLAALAGSTRRVRLGMIHQAHFFRNPALAAKMGATLDQISGGRFIFFADPAFGRAEHLAYNLPYPEDVEERIARTVEGVELTLALWEASEPITFDGRFYRVDGATCTPPPVQTPHPPIWFGEAHPHTLTACARLGDGWNSVPVGPVELRHRLGALADACASVGRPHEEIRCSYETQILIAPDHASLRQRLQEMIDLASDAPATDITAFIHGDSDELPSSLAATYLIGTPAEVGAQMQSYIDLGISHFMLWFMDAPDVTGMQLFAEAVMPRFRGDWG
jgi:alkanesulfonate monooxygenase SsuD/methylene tetrahydromethanopterin reductase-like flavin-dependent oxidoreductase (luciferase family)